MTAVGNGLPEDAVFFPPLFLQNRPQPVYEFQLQLACRASKSMAGKRASTAGHGPRTQDSWIRETKKHIYMLPAGFWDVVLCVAGKAVVLRFFIVLRARWNEFSVRRLTLVRLAKHFSPGYL